MKIWNAVIVDTVNTKIISYIDALLLRFAYAALTKSIFSEACLFRLLEYRFDDYANMMSNKIQCLQDIINSYQHNNIQGYNIEV
jgi:hypothetical protein